MKSNSVLYQLILNRVYRYSAIALGLCLSIAATPTFAAGQNEVLPLTDTTQPRSTPALTPGTSNVPVGETDYTLGAGDLIKLDIFQVAEYSAEYPVLVDGTISLPLVGRVNVNGLTLKETSEAVSKQYSTYLKRPIVTVGLVTPRPLKIGVSGEVDNPGSYEVTLTADSQKFPSVTDLIERAGGITTIADVRNVQVRRNLKGKEVVFNADLWSLLTQSRLNQDIALRDGDTVFIPTVNEINTAELTRLSDASFGLQTDEPIKVAVVGEIYRPGSYTIQPEQLGGNNTTTRDTEPSLPPRLTQAIGVAGGIKPLANVKDVKIKRTAWDGTEKTISVNLWNLIQDADANQDVILQKGDKIVIPQAQALDPKDSEIQATASFSRETITVNVVGEVASPGAQQVQPNTPLNQAILAAGGFDNDRAKTGEVELVRLQPNGTVDKRKIAVDFASGIDEKTNPILRHNDVVVVSRSGVTKATDTAGKIFNPISGAAGILRLFFGF
jgi:polysaccharide export outer membrane protein